MLLQIVPWNVLQMLRNIPKWLILSEYMCFWLVLILIWRGSMAEYLLLSLFQISKLFMQLSALRQIAKKPSKKGTHNCTHCNGDNHVIENCFKLHGYPDWQPKSKSMLSAKSESQTNTTSPTAGFVAKSTISSSALNLSVVTRSSD